MGTINQVFRRESYKKSVLHFFCAFQTSDGEKEKKRRMRGAVESGGFVVFWFCLSCGVVPSRHIAGSVTFRALRTRLPSLRSVVPSRHRNERAGKAGYYGTRCALIRESRIFRDGADNEEND